MQSLGLYFWIRSSYSPGQIQDICARVSDTCSWTPLQDPPSHSPSPSPFFLPSGPYHKSSAPGSSGDHLGLVGVGGGVPDTWHVTLACHLTFWSSAISSGHLGEPCFWLEAGGALLYHSPLSPIPAAPPANCRYKGPPRSHLCSLSLLQLLLGWFLLGLLDSADRLFNFGLFFTCRWIHDLISVYFLVSSNLDGTQEGWSKNKERTNERTNFQKLRPYLSSFLWQVRQRGPEKRALHWRNKTWVLLPPPHWVSLGESHPHSEP